MYDFKIFYPEVYNVYIGFHTILEYCNILKPPTFIWTQ